MNCSGIPDPLPQSALQRGLFKVFSVCFLLYPRVELEMKHVPFCIFQQLGIVIATLTNLWSCVCALIMKTLSSCSSNFCCYQECSGFNHLWVKQLKRKNLEALCIKKK